MTLQFTDFAVLAGLLTAFVGVPTTLLVAYIRAIAGRVEVVEKRVTEIEKGKAGKLDWARETILTRNKLDELTKHLTRLETKADENWGLAAGMRGIADELQKMRETAHGE